MLAQYRQAWHCAHDGVCVACGCRLLDLARLGAGSLEPPSHILISRTHSVLALIMAVQHLHSSSGRAVPGGGAGDGRAVGSGAPMEGLAATILRFTVVQAAELKLFGDDGSIVPMPGLKDLVARVSGSSIAPATVATAAAPQPLRQQRMITVMHVPLSPTGAAIPPRLPESLLQGSAALASARQSQPGVDSPAGLRSSQSGADDPSRRQSDYGAYGSAGAAPTMLGRVSGDGLGRARCSSPLGAAGAEGLRPVPIGYARAAGESPAQRSSSNGRSPLMYTQVRNKGGGGASRPGGSPSYGWEEILVW